ncbi:MAG TPA: phytoene/squalene synthase family protein [Luteibaculaceae bacterium]|jgi:15-cis-phytoene synthase|nr:phytoene/squalene synthase family protein [Luteibaculaceae bacterium]
MKELFDQVSYQCAKTTTQRYSTSFSLGIRFLAADLRPHIYNIYGFVRFADEIVDTFHGFDKAGLLEEFRQETWKAIERGISLNPILNAFQHTVNRYHIDHLWIETFLKSMEMDLYKDQYNSEELKEYILGSAEVVGLMCLHVFTRGDRVLFDALKSKAMDLGSAFQKVNFLRDLHADYEVQQRAYFPDIDPTNLSDQEKAQIEADIEREMLSGYEGIKQLPKDSRFGVYLAFRYYFKLLKKIKKTQSERVMTERIRVSDSRKYAIFVTSLLRHQANLI